MTSYKLKERSRNWVFTYNNFTKNDKTHIYTKKCKVWKNLESAVMQIEEGEKSKILHIQGVLTFTSPKSRQALINDYKKALGVAKCTISFDKPGKFINKHKIDDTVIKKCVENARYYCCKKSTRIEEPIFINLKKGDYYNLYEERKNMGKNKLKLVDNTPRPLVFIPDNKLNTFQSVVKLDIIEWTKTPDIEKDDRSIFNYVGNGRDGKNQLIRNLKCTGFNVCQLSSKYSYSDCLHMIADHITDDKGKVTNKRDDLIVIINLSKDNGNHVPKSLLEDIKDGEVISGKYKGCSNCINSPYLIVFSNKKLVNCWTEDRLKVFNLIQIDGDVIVKKEVVESDSECDSDTDGEFNTKWL